MFKESSSARTYLRAAIATAFAMVAAAGTIWVDNPYLKIISAGLVVLGGYLGVGAISVSEPFYGKHIEVDVPPPVNETKTA